MRYRTRLCVDFNVLGENFSFLKTLVPKNEILFMVKANAYGHGMVPIVQYANKVLGIKEFGVATIEEGAYLRDSLSNCEFEVYVFSDIQLDLGVNWNIYRSRRITPVLSRLEDLKTFLENRSYNHIPLVLKYNTGMNRLGISDKDLEKSIGLLKKYNRTHISHLMSHFSSSFLSINKVKKTNNQFRVFKELKKIFRDNGITVEKSSISNSGAIEQKFGLEESHVRPGLILYGPSSLSSDFREKSLWKGKNISSLETTIISTFNVKKGDPLGYGAIPCPEDGLVGIVSIGYGDGFLSSYQGATFSFKGRPARVVGRISMDMAHILFPPSLKNDVHVGETFRIWGEDSSELLDLSDELKRIPYELFCQLSPRIPRVYNLTQ
ncbi:MAG: alanine racemase [Bdellovibrionota bacterium]|nr:alanine racemase [Bdellovibrionota bacterium]|tara:strand:- start:3606 stop:4742 length:1137 start_codon:yes stop_codon:yes gene_type:complete